MLQDFGLSSVDLFAAAIDGGSDIKRIKKTVISWLWSCEFPYVYCRLQARRRPHA